jgi:N-acetylmuramoyl-L-alanine amidase
MKIFINPGHAPNGIPDAGADNKITGLRECDVALLISNKVADYLKAVGYEVMVLQSNSLSEVVNASNAWGADLFVSIHCNSFWDWSVKGTESWYNDGSLNGKKLASCIHNQIINSIDYNDGKKIVNRGVKNAIPGINGLYVLKYTDCPAVLIETAFISNADDEVLLADKNKRDQFAAATSRGITDYVGGM